MEDNIDVVSEIVEPNFKSGEKNGKPWVIHKILTNSGKHANIFGEVKPGDTVKLTYNEQYKSWNAAPLRKADVQQNEVIAKLSLMDKKLDEIINNLNGN